MLSSVFLLGFWAALFIFVLMAPTAAQVPSTSEYKGKANYLSNFPSFVEWPSDSLPPGQAPFLVCVYGGYSFGTSLADAARSKTVHDKRMEIRWVKSEGELRACQELFVGRSEEKRYGQLLDTLRAQPVLTVGETPGFLEAGGIVSISSQQGELCFDINLGAANKAHLRISSKMLALARRIVNQAEAASGAGQAGGGRGRNRL